MGTQVRPRVVAPITVTQAEVDERVADLKTALDALSTKHIFQWQTVYRDWLSEDFDWFLGALAGYDRFPQMLERIHLAVAEHSEEIFKKGRHYQISQGESEQYAIEKSLNGLRSFLELPIEFYSVRLPGAMDTKQAMRLRALTSRMLSGILTGYSYLNFGLDSGARVLAQHPRSWAHTLPFFTSADLDALLERLDPPNEFVRGLRCYLTPLVEAIEQVGEGQEHMPLPAVAELRWDAGRMNIWLKPSALSPFSQLIELECYLAERFVRQPDLLDATNRGVAVTVVPISGGAGHGEQDDPRLRHGVVHAESDLSKVPETRDAIKGPLAGRAYHQQGTRRSRQQPLGTNVARAFPRDTPNLLPFYIVHRQSIRDLFRSFESRNGVRLWCSVRRSGKTTAGRRLDATSGEVTVIKQTCDTTGEAPNDRLFYKYVKEALENGNWLPDTFFRDAVHRCADGQVDSGRQAFVLDEYETLFGALEAALRRDRDLRYFVVQPLLNQMVEFSRENLIIFLGQQPNAHYILMEQNQLSPYVQQDSFPLFEHKQGEPEEEFAQLVRKVLADPVNPDASFVDAVHSETAGHPYLTVSILRGLVDWLIEEKRPENRLKLTREDFDRFAGVCLRPRALRLNREYEIFHTAVGSALTADGLERSPWQHHVYAALREVARSSPETLRCSRDDFDEIVGGIAPDVDPGGLLSESSNSNFFAFDDHHVWPRIRLLGRIAAVAQGGMQ
ncbi:hypothetical protein AB0C07_26350 [Actinoplanes missouriensis]|uniref:hypothetical protein n=1 Tax=Actinoplanes missouriensis TaxID=1866 RepID=UPI0033D39224